MRVVFFACVMDFVLFERLNVNETCLVTIFVDTRVCVCVYTWKFVRFNVWKSNWVLSYWVELEDDLNLEKCLGNSFYFFYEFWKKNYNFSFGIISKKKEKNVHLYMEIYVIRKMVGKFKNCFWDLSFRGIGIFIMIIPLKFSHLGFLQCFWLFKTWIQIFFCENTVNTLRIDFIFFCSYYNNILNVILSNF